MNVRSLLLALGFAAAVGAQSPLSTVQTTYPANSLFIWTGCTNPNLFYNLTVSTTVTIQGLDVALDAPTGFTGTVEMWITNPGITTYVGNELNAGSWTLKGTGPVTSTGFNQAVRWNLTTGAVLQPGAYGVAIHYVGIRPLFLLGNSTAVPGGTGAGTNQFYQNTELTLRAGETQALSFASGVVASYVWLGRIFYALGAPTHVAASNTRYGNGCYTTNGSFYQRFTCSGPAATALNGRVISLVFTGTGYVLAPGSGVVYIPPTAAAASLTAADEGETAVALTNPMVYPGGVTQTLFVNNNGFISVASNTLPNARYPNQATMLNAPQTAWYSWHDYNPTELGSGLIRFQEVGNLAIFTWDNVESYQAPNVAQIVNRSTFQFQFDTGSGQVNYVWQSMTAIGGSNVSDETVIGFSPGGPSPTVAAIDVTTLTAVSLTVPEVLPLQLDASPSPLPGNTVSYTTSNETGLNVGVFFFCAASLPGINLGVIGMPGCAANVDINQGVGNVISNLGLPGLSMIVQLPVPTGQPGLLGLSLFGQSVWLDPTANAFGARVSNGVQTTIGNF